MVDFPNSTSHAVATRMTTALVGATGPRSFFIFSLAVLLAVLGPVHQAGAGTTSRYQITDLGTLGGTLSVPIDLNDRGDITGVSFSAGDTALRGFLWQRGVMTDLGTLGGPQGAGAGINASKQVIGWSDLTTPARPSIFNTTSLFCNPPMAPDQPTVACHATLFEHGMLTDLGTLGGANSAGQNKGINNRGQVIGVAETATTDPTGSDGAPEFHAFLWKQGRMLDLGTLNGAPDSTASAINDRGQVTGISILNATTFTGENGEGFLWQDGKMTTLKTLGGSYSAPHAINNRGQIVGASTVSGNTTSHAAKWDHHLRVADLGTLPGDGFSEAIDITDQGQIVGVSCASPGACRAVMWNHGMVTDLNNSIPSAAGWHLNEALAQNSRGQIIGDGIHNDQLHAYLLTPMPGPSH